jgi:hypothetical protein
MPPSLRIARVCVFVALAAGIVYAGFQSPGLIVRAVCIGAVAVLIAMGILGRLHRKASTRIIALGLPDGDYPAEIHVSAVLQAEPARVMAVCLAAIESLPNFGSIKRNEPANYISARTRLSRYSWGERITAKAEPHLEGTNLILESVPVLWTVTMDMHFNYQNAALILRYLQEKIGIKRISPSEYFMDIIAADP